MSGINELATEPVGRLLWKYSLPSVVGMTVASLYNVIDRVFIGQNVGHEAINCYNEALKEANNNPAIMPYCMLKLANVYRAQKKYDKRSSMSNGVTWY